MARRHCDDGADAVAVHAAARRDADRAQRVDGDVVGAGDAAVDLDGQAAALEREPGVDEHIRRLHRVDDDRDEHRGEERRVVERASQRGEGHEGNRVRGVLCRHGHDVREAVVVEVAHGHAVDLAAAVVHPAGVGRRVAREVAAAPVVPQDDAGVRGFLPHGEVEAAVHEDVLVTVVVVVGGGRAPAERNRRKPVGRAGIDEGAVGLTQEPTALVVAGSVGHRQHVEQVVAEVRAVDVHVPIAVEVGVGQPHPAAMLGEARRVSDVGELPGAVVLVDADEAAVEAAVLGRRDRALVVGEHDVHVAVLVVVHHRPTPADVRRAADEAGRAARFDERIVARVHEQVVRVVVRKGVEEDCEQVDEVERVGDRDVEKAVAVDVAHRARGSPEPEAADLAAGGDVAEGAVAVVLEEDVGLVLPEDEHVRVAVVVGVAEADAGAVLSRRIGARGHRDVDEAQAPGLHELVGKEAVGRCRTVGDVDVEVAVVVEVEDRHSRSAAPLHREVRKVFEVDDALIGERLEDGEVRRLDALVPEARSDVGEGLGLRLSRESDPRSERCERSGTNEQGTASHGTSGATARLFVRGPCQRKKAKDLGRSAV